MAGLGRSQGSKYGMRGVLAATLGFLLGAFSDKNTADRIKSGNSTGFPLAAKYLRTLNVAKATGRDMGGYVASGTRAHKGNRCQHHHDFAPLSSLELQQARRFQGSMQGAVLWMEVE